MILPSFNPFLYNMILKRKTSEILHNSFKLYYQISEFSRQKSFEIIELQISMLKEIDSFKTEFILKYNDLDINKIYMLLDYDNKKNINFEKYNT